MEFEPAAAPPQASAASEIAEMSFEDALAELERIVRTLEEGRGRLDESIAAYERGAQLKRHCEARLGEAQLRVDQIVRSAGGLATEPFDASGERPSGERPSSERRS